jgi:hypothetical protein
LGMAGLHENLGSPWVPLPVRACVWGLGRIAEVDDAEDVSDGVERQFADGSQARTRGVEKGEENGRRPPARMA